MSGVFISTKGETMSNIGYRKRLTEECVQLDEKIKKLDAFILADAFSLLEETDKALLRLQNRSMNSYLEILLLRIERSKPSS